MYHANGVMAAAPINFDNRDDHYNMGTIRLEEDLVGYRSLMHMDGTRLSSASFNVGAAGPFQSTLQVNGAIPTSRNSISSFTVSDAPELLCENCRTLHSLGLQLLKYEVMVVTVMEINLGLQLVMLCLKGFDVIYHDFISSHQKTSLNNLRE
uniref:Uncharacterized protein n=1 Tax=Physcomitrium patens TaxID=3218 RepID=A0A2K1KZG8_PHYPA|nr:hypothetical protein PHYPA_001986 [Physcomitrium patens]